MSNGDAAAVVMCGVASDMALLLPGEFIVVAVDPPFRLRSQKNQLSTSERATFSFIQSNLNAGVKRRIVRFALCRIVEDRPGISELSIEGPVECPRPPDLVQFVLARL